MTNGDLRYSILVSNHWCGATTSANRHEGDHLPTQCVPAANRNNPNTHPADFELPPGRSTNQYPKYYDTDAVRVYRGCVVNFTIDGNGVQYDRRGKGSLWFKFSNGGRWVVNSIIC